MKETKNPSCGGIAGIGIAVLIFMTLAGCAKKAEESKMPVRTDSSGAPQTKPYGGPPPTGYGAPPAVNPPK